MERNIVIVIPSKDFNDQEYQDIREALDSKGATVKVTSSAREEAVGMASTRVQPDVPLTNISVEDYDGIIFISGPGVVEYFNDVQVLDLARHFYDRGKLVAAISRSVEILARAGILETHSATISVDHRDALLSRNISYTGDDVTVDANVITASSPAHGTSFGRKIAEFLKI